MKTIQSITIDIRVCELTDIGVNWKNLPPNQTFELLIDYPLHNPTTFNIKTGKKGMSLVKLLSQVGKSYEKVYANPNKYGIWGHCIGDLYDEGIEVNVKTNKIHLIMGS